MAHRNPKKDDTARGKHKPEPARPEVDSLDPRDPADEASYESFPASDPPAHTGTHARPDVRREDTPRKR